MRNLFLGEETPLQRRQKGGEGVRDLTVRDGEREGRREREREKRTCSPFVTDSASLNKRNIREGNYASSAGKMLNELNAASRDIIKYLSRAKDRETRCVISRWAPVRYASFAFAGFFPFLLFFSYRRFK